MQDSNQFHAICLDTYPPIFYLNDTSRRVIQLISRYNELHPRLRAAYTFDAGPNAVIIAQSCHVPELLDLVCHYFPPSAQSWSVPPLDVWVCTCMLGVWVCVHAGAHACVGMLDVWVCTCMLGVWVCVHAGAHACVGMLDVWVYIHGGIF